MRQPPTLAAPPGGGGGKGSGVLVGGGATTATGALVGAGAGAVAGGCGVASADASGVARPAAAVTSPSGEACAAGRAVELGSRGAAGFGVLLLPAAQAASSIASAR
jgi:hypothetical protein